MDEDRRETDNCAPQAQARSRDAQDYQDLPLDLAVMSKCYGDGTFIAPHHHPRDQLLYAISGVMRIGTQHETWVVPPDRALWMPAGIGHSVTAHGAVEMRTLYITPTQHGAPKVLNISPLLRALITALAEAPMDYSGDRRAEQIAALITTELATAASLPLNIPLPRDPRLQTLCQRLLQDPALTLSLDHLAPGTGASAKTLARLCQAELGMSFATWRRRVRFSKAFEMLGQGHAVKHVAGRCGYDSPSAFAYAFRRAFGTSPTTVRHAPPPKPDQRPQPERQ